MVSVAGLFQLGGKTECDLKFMSTEISGRRPLVEMLSRYEIAPQGLELVCDWRSSRVARP